MIRISINLPNKRRLHLHLVKRQSRFEEKPLLPKIGDVRRIRKGSKISRYFRYFFEHDKVKRILGANLLVLSLASSFIPSQFANTVSADEAVGVNNSIVLTTEVKVRYPVDKPIVNQNYTFYHPGVDFEGVTGENVYPFMSGIVEAVGYSKIGYGNAIYIKHDGDYSSLYAHLSRIEVVEGQSVDTDTAIGQVGATGKASGDHLHFEIRENGLPINPFTFLSR